MAKHEVLSNVRHKNTKVLTHCSSEFGHRVGAIQILPNEILRAQCEYPILFMKNQNKDGYQCLAILGLHHEENLFLDDAKGWRASYIPNLIKKGPFSIGFQNQSEGGSDTPNPVILIDTEDKRVNETQGKSVFLEFGGNSAYLSSIQNVLGELDQGTKLVAPMFNTLEKFKLLEPCSLDIPVDEETIVKFEGYHTINTENLAKLSGEALEELNKSGLLAIAFAAISSLQNVERLVMLKKLN